MFEFFTRQSEDAIDILKHDHTKVKDLFERFEKSSDLREKKKIVADAIKELKIHAEVEEGIFYPALRMEQVEKDLLNEADEEHHVAKVLIAELEHMDGSEEHYEAKFTVLAENIRHHIKEEEGEMFPQARQTETDFTALGEKMLSRKDQLLKHGVPVSAEAKMIARNKGIADSPAQAAKKHAPKKPVAKRRAAKALRPVKTSVSAKKPAPAEKQGTGKKAAAPVRNKK